MISLAIVSQHKEKAVLVLLLLVGLLGGVLAFSVPYLSNTNVLIGICLLPFSVFISGPRRSNIVYLILFMVFITLTIKYVVRIGYFFALAFYFLWLVERFVGRLNVIILFLVAFMSPFFIQVITILGFPLRLALSDFAGTLLNLAGVHVQVQGNMMMTDQGMFSVDEACMGLNMLVISLLMGVFVLVYRYRISGKTVGLYPTLFFFSVVVGLNLFTNVMRIILLVYFHIPPENPMHEFAGILCLVLYVIVPLHFLSSWLVKKYGQSSLKHVSVSSFSIRNITLITVLPVAVLYAGSFLTHARETLNPNHAAVQYGSIEPALLDDGISKIATEELLIYVKAIPEFFTGEHTPLMCWKGSGYEFSGVATEIIAGVTLYKGILVKDGHTLYTSWWYSNGQVNTISQLDWRMRMLKGETGFCLINVTARDEKTLLKSLHEIFTTNPIIIQR